MISPKTKRNIYRILPFGIIWLVFGLIFLIVEYTVTNSYQYVARTAIKMDASVFIFAMIAVTIVGLLIGVIELLFIHRLFANSSFLKTVLGKIVIYAVFLMLVISIAYPVAVSIELKTDITDPIIWTRFKDYLMSIIFFSTAFQMSVSLIISIVYAEISENMGYHVFANLIGGKYHKPREEQRIFMFLDMKSSTQIAEKLGHISYFELLKNYYNHLANAVINNYGEIYQYVGDEMVLSWKFHKGIKNNYCVQCFFDMQRDLLAKSDFYLKNYGVEPSFKAGLHFGKVTTGEIGSLKKEIIFTGDVLNTTARIQSLCNEYQAQLLISEDLLQKLSLDTTFKVNSIGKTTLRGKQESVTLFTIEKREI